MGLFGSLVSLGFGGGPKMGKLPGVDVQASQAKAIAGNAAALPASKKLATSVDEFTAGQYENMYNRALGGYYGKIRDTIVGNAMDLIGGKIPQTAIDQLMSDTAAKSLYGGFSNTGLSRNLFVRRRLDQILQGQAFGQSTLSSWMNATKTPVYDISRMFISPEFQYSADVNERNAQAKWNFERKQFNYANDPMRGVEGAVSGMADVFGSALSAYLGGFGGIGGIAGGVVGAGSGGGSAMWTNVLNGIFGTPGSGSKKKPDYQPGDNWESEYY